MRHRLLLKPSLPRHRLPVRACALALGFLLAAGCATRWQSSPLATLRAPSPNWGERRFELVVLHHTGETSFARALASLTDPKSGVSAHYLISRTGEIAQLVDERDRAWHAGASRWGPIDDINSASLGIELDNDGDEPFPEAQISALISLLGDVTARYAIDRRNIIGHADIAPTRKADPSRRFPWAVLAAHGFGLWCTPEAREAATDEALPEPDLLRLIGYQVTDERDLVAARHAFRLHFAALDDSGPLDAKERTLLACIASDSQMKRERPPFAAAPESGQRC